MRKKYVQFGSGVSNPSGFENYDSSLSVFFQRHWLMRHFWRGRVTYPAGILFGDIVKGLPCEPESLKGIYSSHVLEHLSYNDCRRAIANSYKYLAQGGIFRCVLPNLEAQVRTYIKMKESGDLQAGNKFMQYTFLGYEERPGTMLSLVRWHFSTGKHFWMWDAESLSAELRAAGFSDVYQSAFNKSADAQFNEAEHPSRFEFEALCLEAVK